MNKILLVILVLVLSGCYDYNCNNRYARDIENIKNTRDAPECKVLYYKYLMSDWPDVERKYYSEWIRDCIK